MTRRDGLVQGHTSDGGVGTTLISRRAGTDVMAVCRGQESHGQYEAGDLHGGGSGGCEGLVVECMDDSVRSMDTTAQ